MENSKKNSGKKLIMAGALLAGSFIASSFTNSASAFSFSDLGTGAEVRANLGSTHGYGLYGADMKCGDSTKTKDGKCGEGKCGDKKADKGKHKDGKCGEGKCGDSKDTKKTKKK